MACTSQSALKYVKNARPHLVKELKSLSVILENLYQQGVLIDEEVSKIKAEKDDFDRTRAILDSVTRRGEDACYRFLRIIDQTRRRTLERPTNEASTEDKKFDLHHWISCFPFKEDAEMQQNYIRGPKPCCKYQNKLKSKAKKLLENFWRASKDLFAENKKPDLFYRAVAFDIQGKISPSKIKKIKNNKSKKLRPKKLRTYIPENKPEISPSDLLKTDKNILLVGKPGIGKTTLSHEILRLWSERDKELDYMFYVDMRKLTNIPPTMSLEDLLFIACSEPDEGKDEVLQDIKSNSDHVTVILDGVTDFSSSIVEKLVEKDFLPDAKIIIACRPDDEEDLCPEDWLRVEVKGFSEETIKTYLSSALGENHRKVLSNVELLTLCHVPMYALMVAASFSSEDSLQPRTKHSESLICDLCRLSEERLQQLLVLLHEVQDQDRTLSLLNKVGGDLSSCRLSWELLHYLLQQPTAQTVNLKKNRFLEERAAQLLPFLHRMVIQRPSPSFVRTSIKEIFRTHHSHLIPGLLRSLGHVINLNCTELDSEDCDALLFILRHSDGVKLRLLWSSIPAEGIQSILSLLHTVSDLSVDRNLLLRFIHCCASSDSQQGAASDLLRTLQHRLDLSCSSCVQLPEEDQTEPLSLTTADCRAVSIVLRHSSRDTQLDLRDCEVEDSGLDLLFPVLDRVRLIVSKTILVQLLSLLAVNNQRDTVRRTMSLCRALGEELESLPTGSEALWSSGSDAGLL
ncbi:uncharacterized protein LOC103149489 [Poecilia formosa]|uniref:uncharacterized protein LOC103149489 n=1 Tax=Poecilia formosa TaxID=48698 RepID=UPI0007BAC3AF|nr:PREDICTED: uncharacterized protein LOC103149489 [Poecilia formosa]